MKTFQCRCQNTLFFDNTQCIQCQREVGWCPRCDRISPLIPIERAENCYRCGHGDCQAELQKCHNYVTYCVCNRCLTPDSASDSHGLCDYCRYNVTIPDLSVAGNLEKWRRIEAAKRRLLYTLELLNLPLSHNSAAWGPPLEFAFKGDIILRDSSWRKLGTGERVYTGHADGTITLNIQEADPVEREKLRVDMNESHRTLIGHFHHEIGHYYWQVLVTGDWIETFKTLFGDHQNPTYSEALNRYYAQSSPPQGWEDHYISAYATMHPWEDFAETFGTYLDMVTVLDTAHHVDLQYGLDVQTCSFAEMIQQYKKLGIILNELNRTLGLLDFVPEVFSRPVAMKLEFIHDLLRSVNYEDK